MPSSSPLPSPMALNRPPTSHSIFKKRSTSSLSPMASAASYLSALSQADARARSSTGRSPTSTPALSLSSSVTQSSEDTVLDESEFDNGDGLTIPPRPPTSEQVFTTVHTEFGHCANEDYRITSEHVPGDSLSHAHQDPPYYVLLSTYISYLILIVMGHIRDFVGKRFHPSAYKHLMPHNVSNFLLISKRSSTPGAWL